MASRAMASMLICFLLAAPSANATISCGAAVGPIASCISFVIGKAFKPAPSCCSGVRTLNSLARTTADRRAGCVCLKNYANRIKGLIASRVSNIPRACGVNLPFPISPSTNCNAIP